MPNNIDEKLGACDKYTAIKVIPMHTIIDDINIVAMSFSCFICLYIII